MVHAIEVKGVVKNFGSKRVLKNISFNVRKNTIHGYLGHNAAGKTTTIRIALGLLTADEGDIKIFGVEPQEKPEVKARIGYVSGEFGLYSSSTVKENLIRFYEFYGVSEVQKTMDELIEELALQEFVDSEVKTLSAGTKQRLAIARGMAGPPELLILDEPMSNLDPIHRHKLKEKIKKLKRDGCTVLMTTHILSDVEELCDFITIIKDGQILFDGSIKELYSKVSLGPLVVRILVDDWEKAYQILSKNYSLTKSENNALFVSIEKKDEVPIIARAINELNIYELRLFEPSLEVIYTTLHNE